MISIIFIDQEAPQKKDPFLVEAPTNDPWSCSTEIKTAEPINDPWLTPADPWAPSNPVSTATTQPSTVSDVFQLTNHLHDNKLL